MTPTSYPTYEGIIPGQEEGTAVDFYIQILGIEGEIVESGSFIYEVNNTIFGVEPILFYLVGGIFLIIVLIALF